MASSLKVEFVWIMRACVCVQVTFFLRMEF